MPTVRSSNELAGVVMALAQEAETAKVGASPNRAAGWLGRVSMSVWRGLSAIVGLLLAWRRLEAERRHLAGLSDYHLRDLGLARPDMEDVSSHILWFR
jgi:uncharacterized protein YjiS (DUF1127 family)